MSNEREMTGSPSYAFDIAKRWTAVRKWRMPWSEAGQFLGGRINETLPAPDGLADLMVGTGGTIKPWADVAAPGAVDATEMSYEFAVVTVNYAFPSDVLIEVDGNNKKFSIQFQPNMEVLSLDHERFQWGTDDSAGIGGKTIKLTARQAPFVKFFTMDIVETRYEVELTGQQFGGEIFSFIGRTNKLNINYKGVVFPKGTLLYNAPTLVSTGALWTITYRYSYKLQTWNKFYKEDQPANARFLSIWTTGETPEKFVFAPPTANFALLPGVAA